MKHVSSATLLYMHYIYVYAFVDVFEITFKGNVPMIIEPCVFDCTKEYLRLRGFIVNV